MNSAIVLSILGSLGGIVVFIGAVFAVVRAVFSLTGATKDNTQALKELSDEVHRLGSVQGDHGERLARLEGEQGIGLPRRRRVQQPPREAGT